MVLPLQWLPEEKDRQWILVWIFCPSLRSISPELEILDLIQYLRQLRWRWGIPGDQCTDQLAFSLCLALDRQSLFRWFNVLLRSCLQHLLFQWWVALGATIAYRFQFWLHLPQWVQDLPRLHVGNCIALNTESNLMDKCHQTRPSEEETMRSTHSSLRQEQANTSQEQSR
jgi:hypothetical protein